MPPISDWKFFVAMPALFLIACQPSQFLEKRHVTYNFQDEGFLSNHVLQTTGSAQVTETRWGTAGGKRLCLGAAEQEARRRSLRVMLHTRLEIPAGQAAQGDMAAATFERDYPYAFSVRDLIRAELDFRVLLDRGFIALQENRKRGECSLVFRIESTGELDLPAEIRQVSLSFEPEQSPWRKNQIDDKQRPPSDSLHPAPVEKSSDY
jgi:hypothetical protein